MVSEKKKANMKYGVIIGAVVGVALFIATYSVNNSWAYLIFIPIAAAMGWATQYVKDEDTE
ncbi:MAG: hypothetical protein LBG63_01650 [Candidatus Methanoplasma sp.]|jgi:4-hydroxybenzoate polyprenyltransferase|nr:hypothetical protein [Candidatus Methanoplasma sp.]